MGTHVRLNHRTGLVDLILAFSTEHERHYHHELSTDHITVDEDHTVCTIHFLYLLYRERILKALQIISLAAGADYLALPQAAFCVTLSFHHNRFSDFYLDVPLYPTKQDDLHVMVVHIWPKVAMMEFVEIKFDISRDKWHAEGFSSISRV